MLYGSSFLGVLALFSFNAVFATPQFPTPDPAIPLPSPLAASALPPPPPGVDPNHWPNPRNVIKSVVDKLTNNTGFPELVDYLDGIYTTLPVSSE